MSSVHICIKKLKLVENNHKINDGEMDFGDSEKKKSGEMELHLVLVLKFFLTLEASFLVAVALQRIEASRIS